MLVVVVGVLMIGSKCCMHGVFEDTIPPVDSYLFQTLLPVMLVPTKDCEESLHVDPLVKGRHHNHSVRHRFTLHDERELILDSASWCFHQSLGGFKLAQVKTADTQTNVITYSSMSALKRRSMWCICLLSSCLQWHDRVVRERARARRGG